jgi:hypothetical protein
VTYDPGLKRLEQALANLDADKKLPPNWRARVLVETKPKRSRWRTRIWGFAALAAAAAAWFISRSDRDRPFSPQFAVIVHPVSGGRGTSASLGDTLEVSVADAPHLAIWVYRNDELMLACPGGAGCTSSDRRLGVKLKLQAVGDYAVVALFAKQRIPDPQGKRDPDMARVESSGVLVREHAMIVH